MVKSEKHTKSTKTTIRVGKFAIIGAILTVVNYLLYTFLSQVIIKDNNLLPLASFISTFFITFLAYFLHSKITWKERHPNRASIVKFFIWNFLLAIIICPFLTWLFSNMKLFYELAFNISNTINLQFEYDFIESTGAFCFTTAVTMVLNYLFYDKFVFGSQDVVQTHIYNNNLKSIKVSIIVPIYNTEKYLTDCIDSIIKQTHDNLEIILIDDGSTDNSGKIADKYAKKDKRIKVIHQKNQGQSTARNIGLTKATGNYISFVDSDDEIKKTFITDLLSGFSDKNTSLSVCGIHYKRLKYHDQLLQLHQTPYL
jgi:putative flippase GtrA